MPAHLTLTNEKNEKPATRTNRGGLDFVLQTATHPYEGQVHVYIFETCEINKPSS